MENCKIKFSAKELAEEIMILVKDEIVAFYENLETAFSIRFLDGKEFVVSVQEVERE